MATQLRQKPFNVSSGEVIALPADAGANPKITSITRQKSEGAKFASTLPQAGNWKIVNGAVQFLKAFSRIQIFYERQLTLEQGEAIFGKDQMDNIAAFRGQMAASVEGLQFDKMNLEGSVVKDFGESGGFKAVQNFAQPFKSLTDRPMLAKTTANTGVGLTEVSSQLTAISAIAGKQRSNGVLKKTTTQMNPKAMLKVCENLFPRTPKETLRKSVATAALNPTTVVTTLAPENEPTAKANSVVEKTYKEKISLLNNCGSNLDPTSLLGGIGRSKQNAFAH